MDTGKLRSKRFGVVAVENQFLTQDQVMAALRIQVDENVQKGIHRQIGAILFEMGYLNAGQIQMVLGQLTSSAKLAV